MKALITAFALALSVNGALAADAGALYNARLPGLDRQPQALASLRGKPSVVNFWARWCPPCRKEIPELNAFHKQAGDAVQVIGIAIEEHSDNAVDFARAYEIAYPLTFAGPGGGLELMRALGNDKGGLPYTVVLDADGRILSTHLGAVTLELLQQATAGLH